MQRNRVGVIGFGYWGPNLVRNLHDLPGVDLVAVADLREDRLDKVHRAYPGMTITKDYRDFFQMGIEAVALATPPATHFPIAKDCLEHGVHVLVEKPIALKSEDASSLCETAKKYGVILMVGHTFEYNAAVRALKKMIDDKELGEIYYIDTARLNLGLFQTGLNSMWDLAPHDISIINYILDSRPTAVSAVGTSCVMDAVEDVVYMNLVYPGGILAHIHVSWLDPCKVRRVTLVGSKKMIVYNDVEANEKIKIYDKSVVAQHEARDFAEYQWSYRVGDILIPNIRFEEPLRAECQHFIDCVVHNTPPVSCGEDGAAVVRVLEAAQRSLNNSGHQEVLRW